MKIGVSLRIDVSKIDRDHDLFKGAKGTYLNMTTFIDLDEKDQYGNNGFIAVEKSKEERQQGVKGAILGNAKVFYQDSQQSQTKPSPHANNPQGYAQNQAAQYAATHQAQAPKDDFDQDIPF